MNAMRHDDDSTWCDVGQYRARIERQPNALRFSVHGKPDLSQGFAQPTVVARGWIRDGSVLYQPGCGPLDPELERDLLVASRRLAVHAV